MTYGGETDSDSDYSFDDSSYDDNDNELDIIYHNDYDKLKYKIDKKYYIGLSDIKKNLLILANAITPDTFFKYSYQYALRYLYEYSIFKTTNPSIDILQLNIENCTYCVVKKTYWIRIIQRHWKNIYKKKYDMLLQRGNIFSQNEFSINGKYPTNIRNLPSIHGMLSQYS
jgi:hypothetical protein